MIKHSDDIASNVYRILIDIVYVCTYLYVHVFMYHVHECVYIIYPYYYYIDVCTLYSCI